MTKNNKGFEAETIAAYKAKISAGGKSYTLDTDDEQSDEFAHFYFIGEYENKEVIYDTVIYTLRLHHESEIYEVAEERAQKQFPEYRKMVIGESDNAHTQKTEEMEEEIGLFMAEVILELEEEDSIKVKEHVDQDIEHTFGISLDVGRNVEKVTADVISKFIRDFNEDKLSLDETLYSFQTGEEEDD